MKKLFLTIIIGFSVIFMTGCGETNQDNLPNLDNEFSEFKVSYSGLDVTPGVKFDYKKVVGEEPEISTIAGCALYGYDHVYTYDDIEIVANINEEDNVETVYSVYLRTDKVSTPEGIKIGSTVDELINTYGDNFDEFNGVYTFNGVGIYMQVQTKDNLVTSIEYIMVTN